MGKKTGKEARGEERKANSHEGCPGAVVACCMSEIWLVGFMTQVGSSWCSGSSIMQRHSLCPHASSIGGWKCFCKHGWECSVETLRSIAVRLHFLTLKAVSLKKEYFCVWYFWWDVIYFPLTLLAFLFCFAFKLFPLSIARSFKGKANSAFSFWFLHSR